LLIPIKTDYSGIITVVTRSASAFITHNKKILLLHRDNIPTIHDPNMWGSIGGMVENGELKDIKLGNEGQELRFFSFDELETLPIGKNIKFYLTKFGDPIKRLIEGEDASPADLGLS